MTGIYSRRRRLAARLADGALYLFYLAHSTLTLRRWRKKRPVKKVLIYAAGFIGDTIIAIESIRAIKRRYPDTTVVINPGVRGFFKGIDTIGFVPPWLTYGERIDLEKIGELWRFIRQIKRERFDLAIDLRGDLRNNLLLYLSGAPTRVGFPDTGGAYFLTNPVERTKELEVERYRELAKAIGAKPGPYTRLTIPREDQTRAEKALESEKIGGDFIVIIPSAGYPTKEWPVERWTALATMLKKKGWSVVLLGSPADKKFEVIAKDAGVTSMIGELSLWQSAAVMKEARLVVGADTGAMHLAAGVGADTLTLFGPTRPSRWRPVGPGMNSVIDKSQHCSPCGKLFDCPIHKECMTRITVDEVLKRIDEVTK